MFFIWKSVLRQRTTQAFSSYLMCLYLYRSHGCNTTCVHKCVRAVQTSASASTKSSFPKVLPDAFYGHKNAPGCISRSQKFFCSHFTVASASGSKFCSPISIDPQRTCSRRTSLQNPYGTRAAQRCCTARVRQPHAHPNRCCTARVRHPFGTHIATTVAQNFRICTVARTTHASSSSLKCVCVYL